LSLWFFKVKLKIIFRVDSSVYIGTGHVMRCLVLANALTKQGNVVSFASRGQPGDLIGFIRNKGYEVHELAKPALCRVPINNADYEAWLQVPWQQDADSLIQQIDTADVLIVDHYGLNADWERYVKKSLGCKVIVIDDLVRDHDADMIIDQTHLRAPQEYKLINSNTEVLAGCAFALISPLFSDYRAKLPLTKTLCSKPKVLVSMGGIDSVNATLKVLKELVHKDCLITVLLSPQCPSYSNVVSFCHLNSNKVTHLDFTDDMAGLMSQHDIAVGAPGSTAWERACLGIPSIIIPVAENQNTNCVNLLKAKAVLHVELEKISEKLQMSYDNLVENFTLLRTANLALCDGLGVRRVSSEINLMLQRHVSIRKATLSDIDIVYEWQSSPSTRVYFKNSDVPEYSEHLSWMSDAVQSNSVHFYMIMNNGVSVGLVRLNMLLDLTAEVSILISPKYYGNGFAKSAMHIILERYDNYIIKAFVNEKNIASQKLFESLLFIKRDKNQYEWRS